MKTNFTTLDKTSKIVKETIFTHYINSGMEIKSHPGCTPNSFQNVLHIGCDRNYGDVFKCWSGNDSKDFTIYFGTKGDEFNQ